MPGFHPTTVKIMTDGVLENYTGALLEPYGVKCISAGSLGLPAGLAPGDERLR